MSSYGGKPSENHSYKVRWSPCPLATRKFGQFPFQQILLLLSLYLFSRFPNVLSSRLTYNPIQFQITCVQSLVLLTGSTVCAHAHPRTHARTHTRTPLDLLTPSNYVAAFEVLVHPARSTVVKNLDWFNSLIGSIKCYFLWLKAYFTLGTKCMASLEAVYQPIRMFGVLSVSSDKVRWSWAPCELSLCSNV